MLFDLDGTLIDSALDLGDALNHVLTLNNKPTVNINTFRPWVSNGSIAMLKGGFGSEWEVFGQSKKKQLQHTFLSYYKTHLFNKTQLYHGIRSLIIELEQQNIPWGIMTNKPSALTDPLIAQVEAFSSAIIVVSGDTLDVAKPSPRPLLYCAEKMNVEPHQCIYIGDDERDIIAGKAAKMHTAVAMWGYLNKDVAQSWQADYYAQNAQQLHNYILG